MSTPPTPLDLAVPILLNKKQQLALEFTRTANLDTALTGMLEAVKDQEPFKSDPLMFHGVLKKAVESLKRERAVFSQFVEDTYDEEELQLLIDLAKNPLWTSIQAKMPAVMMVANDVLRRVLHTLDQERAS